MRKDVTDKITVPDGIVGACHIIPDEERYRKKYTAVFVNGGPGGTYLRPECRPSALSLNRPAILYDQLGCHHSPAPFGPHLIDMDRYASELLAVLDYFGLEKAIIVGHSFGGSVALDFALLYPHRVAGLVLSSPLISTPRWIADANFLLSQLPPEEYQIISRHNAGEDVDKEAYDKAEKVFYDRHLCRLNPWPADLQESFSKGNKDIYRQMWGQSEFVCTGSLKNYDRFEDLQKLTMPVLMTCGRYDEARPETMEDAASRVPQAKLHIFEESSHTPMLEQTEEYITVLRDFCDRIDV